MTSCPAPGQPPAPTDEVLVTVVVPAYDEEASIGACLGSVLAQDWRNLQVLVVDGASTDGTAALVAAAAHRDDRVELLTNPRRTVTTSLNTALTRAKGEYLVRVDAHSAVPPEYVRLAVGHLATGRYGGVGGRKDGVGRTPAGRAVAAAMASRLGVGGSRYHYGTAPARVEHVPFGAYPVAVLRALGGWDEQLTDNEDFELDHRLGRAGHALLFDPHLRIDWECRQSVGALARQYHRYGRGKVAVVAKHPRSLRRSHLAAPALVLQLLGALGLLLARRPRLAAASLAPYAGALAAGHAVTARRLDPAARRYVVPAYLAMHLGWGTGFWRAAAALAARRVRRA